MAPHLRHEVIAAIETAVDCNDGALESAFIHSLAKIYKTSPQAIVYNMKRYNKVKANMDDRQKGGRPAAMDKDIAAEATREFIAECPGIKIAGICQKLHQRFDKEFSTTWVTRLMQRYEIVHREPKLPKVKKVRIPKVPKQVTHSQSIDQAPVYPGYTGTTSQYQLSAGNPNTYPSFREDLQRAIVAPRLPPAEGQPAPDEQSRHDEYLSRLSIEPGQIMRQVPAGPYQHPPMSYYPRPQSSSSTPSSSSDTSFESVQMTRRLPPPRTAPPPSAPGVVWQVVKVVKCPP